MAPPFTGMFLLVGLLLLPQSTLASTNEFIPSMSVSDAVDSDSSIPLANMANKMKEGRISLKSNAPDCSSGSSSSSRYHALVCWLWNAQVTLPDESFQEELVTIVSTSDLRFVFFCILFLSILASFDFVPDNQRNDLYELPALLPLQQLHHTTPHISSINFKKSNHQSKTKWHFCQLLRKI
jgi:hypothetical protein